MRNKFFSKTRNYREAFVISFFLTQDGLFSDDARVSLLRRDATDPEVPDPVAPAWAGRVEGLNYQISRYQSTLII